MDFIIANQAFILGLITTLIVWIIFKITGKTLDKTKINSALAIIQDIKINPATKDLDDYAKKQLAVERATKSLPGNQTNLVMKIFGTIGGAVEYVFHNRKWLFSIGKAIKGVF
ncbi:MAG TPA: hypothetical protein P5018_08420 [Rectinema sp.]|jgi:hypothetical protein|nr:hypothetical protein [Synergistaceae bacterium]MDD2328498.1 hypothetical protein [bacterium]HRS32914.1 hypothetical protein [Rectinema sp.]HRU78590.1 hypothetical protein [Rectinema sp.]